MLKNLLRQECEIFTKVEGTGDEMNDATVSYTSEGTFICRLEGWKQHEVEIDRDTRVSFFHLYLDERAHGHINGLSRVVLEGTTYEVIATPQTHYRRGGVNHLEVVLRQIEG